MLINNKVPLTEKLQLVYDFFVENWNTDLIKDDRLEPPTVEQMDSMINKSTFPALKILELERMWRKARMYFYMAGNDSMLIMDGDPSSEDEEENFNRLLEHDEKLNAALKNQDEEFLVEYEKKTGIRYIRFPKEIIKDYTGTYRQMDIKNIILDNPHVCIPTGDMTVDIIDAIERINLEKPITIRTVAYETRGVTSEFRIQSIFQA